MEIIGAAALIAVGIVAAAVVYGRMHGPRTAPACRRTGVFAQLLGTPVRETPGGVASTRIGTVLTLAERMPEPDTATEWT